MKFVITGGAGFIGSHLAERLIERGDSVAVLDDLSSGTLNNLDGISGSTRFEFVAGSVLDQSLVRRLVEGSDVVVHLAATVGVRTVLRDPLGTIRTNFNGTEIVLDAAATFKKKILVASSSEVYGKNGRDQLCEEDDSVLGSASLQRWSYATSKKLDEFLALAYADTYNLPVVVTRFFNVVGPRQRSRYGMVVPNFIRAALSGRPINVFGDGQQTRNFCFVHDVIRAIELLMDRESVHGEIFNIGGEEEISILDLAQRVKRLSGSTGPIVKVSYEKAYPEGGYEDMRRRVPCLCKIRGRVGWLPATSMDAMLMETIDFQRAQQEMLEVVETA